jgi:hypothetical protein
VSDAPNAMTEPIEPAPPPVHLQQGVGGHPPTKYAAVDYVFQFVTITGGVLIALFVNGLVEWNHNRELVLQARDTIRREVQANLKELEGLAANVSRTGSELENALRFAQDLLGKGKTDIRTLTLNFNLATLSASGWQTADRIGALAHMDYDEVQEYSELYSMQELFDTQQRTAVDLVATASAFVSPAFDPTRANRDDLLRFRERVMLLQASLLVTDQLGQQLIEGYEEFLQKNPH